MSSLIQEHAGIITDSSETLGSLKTLINEHSITINEHTEQISKIATYVENFKDDYQKSNNSITRDISQLKLAKKDIGL
jgi:hypothetical protein